MEALWNSCSSLPLDYLDLKLLGSPLSAVQRAQRSGTPPLDQPDFFKYVLVTQVPTKEFLFNLSCVIEISLIFEGNEFNGWNIFLSKGNLFCHIGSISVKGRTTRSHSLSLLRTAISAILWHWDEAIGKPTGGEGAVNLLILSHFKKIISRCPPAQ